MGTGTSEDHDDGSLGLHVRRILNNSQSAPHFTPQYHSYEPQTHVDGRIFEQRPMSGRQVSPKRLETLDRSLCASTAGSLSLDNTEALLQPMHHRARYQPISHGHRYMSPEDTRVQMLEGGSSLSIRSDGNNPLVPGSRFADASYSPFRRHAAMSRKDDIGKMWGGGEGDLYSAMHDPQGGRRSPFAQQSSLNAASNPRRLSVGHSDRELAQLFSVGNQVPERLGKFSSIEWR